MKEIFECLEERYTVSEIVELLNEFDRNDLEEYAIGRNICPRCGGKLLVHRFKEDRGEFWGFPCKETIEELICEDCNETY